MNDTCLQLIQTKYRFILIIKIDLNPPIATLKIGEKTRPFGMAIFASHSFDKLSLQWWANAQLLCSFSYGEMHIPFQVIQIIFAVLPLYNNIENMHDYILSWSHILLINI